MSDWTILTGDCIELMHEMDEGSIDAIVCDPPYGLEFMGKEWDRLGDVGQASHQGFDTEGNFKGFKLASYNASANVKCRRCRKWKWDYPERKCVCEPFGDFPNVKADQARRMQEWHRAWATEALRILKPGGHLLAFGGTRTSHRLACAVEDAGFEIRDSLIWLYGSGFPKSHNGDWGGTALKPSHEPVVMARKPLSGTVAQNVTEHGTGALNIAGCRIEGGERPLREAKGETGAIYGAGLEGGLAVGETSQGRWPANVALSPEAAQRLDAQAGESTSRIGKPREGQNGDGWGMTATGVEYDDQGGPSRFFYCAKSSRGERNAGLDGFDVKVADPYGRAPRSPHGRQVTDRRQACQDRAERPSNGQTHRPNALAGTPRHPTRRNRAGSIHGLRHHRNRSSP